MIMAASNSGHRFPPLLQIHRIFGCTRHLNISGNVNYYWNPKAPLPFSATNTPTTLHCYNYDDNDRGEKWGVAQVRPLFSFSSFFFASNHSFAGYAARSLPPRHLMYCNAMGRGIPFLLCFFAFKHKCPLPVEFLRCSTQREGKFPLHHDRMRLMPFPLCFILLRGLSQFHVDLFRSLKVNNK